MVIQCGGEESAITEEGNTNKSVLLTEQRRQQLPVYTNGRGILRFTYALRFIV